jgi:MATE family multidrug resistance protein
MTNVPPTPLSLIETEGLKNRVIRHTSELIRLAGPIVVSRSGLLLLALADTVMTGRYNTAELAYLSIGMGVLMPLLITAIGMIMGTLVLTANAFGGERYEECGPIWRRSIFYALLIGIGCVVVGFFGEHLMLLLGQRADVAYDGGRIFLILSLGLPGHLLFLSSAYFLEGIGRPKMGMFVMIWANVLNVILNWGLINGTSWLGPMGAEGAAWGTTASRWFMAVSAAGIIWFMADHERFNIRGKLAGGLASWQELRRMGYAIGLSSGAESISFAALNVFAGWLGKLPLAAYGLTLNLLALTFMIALGVGSATSVRVGIAYSRGDHKDAALAGWTGLGVNSTSMLVAAIVTYFFAGSLAGIYTDDPALLREAIITVAFLSLVYVPDGGQVLMAHALRGRKDVWAPSMIQMVSFFGVMVPVGYTSAFIFEAGVVGLFQGILAGCIVSLIWLSIRFQWLAKQDAKNKIAESL